LNNKYAVGFAFLIVGLFSSFNGQFDSITLSELSMIVPILGIIFWIYKKGLQQTYTLDEMIPSKKEMIVPFIYLLGIYLVLGISILPEVMTINNQIPIWLSYIVFGYLFYMKLNANRFIDQTDSMTKKMNFKMILVYTFVILIFSAAFAIGLYFSGIKEPIQVVTWIIWIISGLFLLMYSIFSPKLSEIKNI
jgi:hypothetical protein